MIRHQLPDTRGFANAWHDFPYLPTNPPPPPCPQLLIRYFTHFENHFMISKQYHEIYLTVFKPEFKPEEVGGKYATTEEKLQVPFFPVKDRPFLDCPQA